MTEPTELMLSPRELAEALVKHHGIREGIWSLGVEFQLTAINMSPDKEKVLPAAVVPIHRIGIRRTDALNNISVDAAALNAATASAADRFA